MSFAKDVKMQILNVPIEDDCCRFAFLSGLLRACGEYDEKTQKMSFTTDMEKACEFVNGLFKALYRTEAELETADGFKIHKTNYYKATLPPAYTHQMLTDFGLIEPTGEFSIDKLDESIFECDNCRRAFLKGMFLGCGTSGIRLDDPQRTTTGYDVEFVSKSHDLLQATAEVLVHFDISPRCVKRKNHFVLYIKESGQVSDILALVGAHDSVIKLQDELSLRELRNKINREVNCEKANISKVVEASVRQTQAINIISDRIGLSELPDDLQEVALLRLANPEESLDELLNLSLTKLTKSALYHKFKKLEKIAKNIE